MKRFHVHVSVDDLAKNIDFYTKLFGQAPSKQQSDYAKWMLEDPRINFAISQRGHAVGLNHFGMQVDSNEELVALRLMADAASNGQSIDQANATCCYAKSEKHWTLDPQGLAWEHYYTMGDAKEFGDNHAPADSACCIPVQVNAEQKAAGNCCVPQTNSTANVGVTSKDGKACCA